MGSQRVSSIIYQKAKELIREGAIGKLNLIEAWWERPVDSDELVFRNSIPPDASPSTIDWDRFVANTTRRPFDAQRFFWWHNYGTTAPAYRAICSCICSRACTSCSTPTGPVRVMATGGTRYWNDGREIPDLMLGMADYAEGAQHPAFNLRLRVNFEQGAEETSGFRFVGEKGILRIGGDGVRLARHNRPPEPGYNIETFAEAPSEEYLREYRKKYPVAALTPETMRMTPVRGISGAGRVQRSRRAHGQFLRRGAQPQAGGGGRGVRVARGRSGAAGQCQPLRAEDLHVGPQGYAADGVSNTADAGPKGLCKQGEQLLERGTWKRAVLPTAAPRHDRQMRSNRISRRHFFFGTLLAGAVPAGGFSARPL